MKKQSERVARLNQLDKEILVAELHYRELVEMSRQFYQFRIGLRRQKNSINVYLRWRLLQERRQYLSVSSERLKNIVARMSKQQVANFVELEKARSLAEFHYSLLTYERSKLKDVTTKFQQANLLRQIGN